MPDAPRSSLLHRLGLPPGARAVIVSADDLGMCHASTEGCAAALEHGVATTASLLVPCPWGRYAAERTGGLDVGVHLTLTAEWPAYRWGPITGGRSLRVADGGFPRSVAHVTEHADVGEVRAELAAQVDRALAWDVDVTHLDAHMYTVQDDRRLAEAYLELAAARGLPVRLSGSIDRPDAIRRRAAELGVVAPDHLVPLPAMGSRGPILAALRDLPAGVTELHAHPAIDTAELRAIAPDWATRVDDHRLLVPGREVADMIRAAGAVPIGYGALRTVMRSG